MKKYYAEFLGTFVLVLFGCGSAALTKGINGSLGILGISMAFGLSIVAMAYAIGHISGCHVNPAVSLAMAINKKITWKEFAFYAISQVLGAIFASSILVIIIGCAFGFDQVKVIGLGQNGFDAASFIGINMWGALLVETILTFVFVLVIFGVTSSKKTAHMGGLVIGLTLAFVHILGIAITGTSVNPARSLAPAIFLGGTAIKQVWVFIVAPFVGAALAALVWRLFNNDKLEEDLEN